MSSKRFLLFFALGAALALQGCNKCGDGKLKEKKGEECDDGNVDAGDGCSPECLNEAGGPEVCVGGVDEDGDGAIDCADADCANDAACTNQNTGSPCAADAQCSNGNCLDEVSLGFPSGYCSGTCDDTDPASCGADQICLLVGFIDPNAGTCLDVCDLANGDADCRDAYTCADDGSGVTGICFPSCTDSAQCPAVGFCQTDPNDINVGFCATELLGGAEVGCFNGVDDDLDGAVDCDDNECAALPECQEGANPGECTDIIDNDNDGDLDCGDATACQGTADCTPGNTATGGACAQNNNCQATGGDPFCFTEAALGFPGGMCSEFCNLAANDCGGGNSCLDFGLNGGLCFVSCVDNTDCPNGFECIADPTQTLANNVCFPQEVCGDGVDNNLNGLQDCSDDGNGDGALDCADTSACDGACNNAISANASNSDDTTNGRNFFVGQTCIFGAGGGNEVLFSFIPGVAGQTGELTLTLQSATDQGIYVLGNCTNPSSEVGCVDNEIGGTDEVLTLTVDNTNIIAGDALTIVVDAFTPGEEGPFTLLVSFVPDVCGDGLLTGIEECDDINGTPVSGDGCSDVCTLEGAPFQCDTTVEPTVCVDLTQACQTGIDIGDITVATNGDTSDVNAANRVDTAFFPSSCTGGAGIFANIFTTTIGGNATGTLALTLQSASDQGVFVRSDCTDANTELGCIDANGGGTDEVLDVVITDPTVPLTIFVSAFDIGQEGPYTLTGVFAADVCGDGQQTGGEGCDDINGAPVDGDGCSAQCQVEPGFICNNAVQPSACIASTEQEPNNDTANANANANNNVGSIFPSLDVDFYAIDVTAGQTITAQTVDPFGGTACADFELDSLVEILDIDGTTVLESDDDGGDGFCSLATATVANSGTAFVRVLSTTFDVNGTFNYQLNITVQ